MSEERIPPPLATPIDYGPTIKMSRHEESDSSFEDVRAEAYSKDFTAHPTDDKLTSISAIKPAPEPSAEPAESQTIPSQVVESNQEKVAADREMMMGSASPTNKDSSTLVHNVPANEPIPAIAPNERHIHGHHDTEPERFDVGWNASVEETPSPLVTGIANEDLWLLIRRFNMQMYHVRAIDPPPGGQLDLNTVADEEFSSDKLRANLERLYMTVIVGIMAFVKHIARLRSWHERKRTAIAATAYFLVWSVNMVMPALFLFLTVLIIYPASRTKLFPPAPLAAVSHKTGGLQKPPAGALGSNDSLTGAPEAHKGQAVEQEASNFVSGFASVAVGTALGKGPTEPGTADEGESAEDQKGEPGAKIPDPTAAVFDATGARAKASGQPTGKHDKTKEPMQQAIWEKARPVMSGVAEVSDTWERLANALSPTPPFPKDMARLKVAALVAGPGLVSLILPVAWMFRGLTLIGGLAFFTEPQQTQAWHWLNQNYPNWMDMLKLENTILYGIPTNAQLTLTLLRLGEAHKAPLPPPPKTDIAPPSPELAREPVADLPVDASPQEIHDNSLTPQSTVDEESPKKSKRSKLLGFMKGAAKTGVTTFVGVDRVRAQVGSEHAKDRKGVLPWQKQRPPDGPSFYTARCDGKKGLVTISTTATSPCVSYEATSAKSGSAKPVWSVALNEIAGLKKVNGLGFKSRLLVGFALGMEIVDGIIIEAKDGSSYHLTAVPRRDELFNRLIALGGQSWACH